MWDPLSSWKHLEDLIRSVGSDTQIAKDSTSASGCLLVWALTCGCFISLEGRAGQRYQGGIQRLQGRRKEEFLAFGEHSILSGLILHSHGGLLFSDFAQMMKGGFGLHLEEFLKHNLIIIEKKSSKAQPAHPSKQKMLSKFHFNGFSFSFTCLQESGRPIKKLGMNAAVIKNQK